MRLKLGSLFDGSGGFPLAGALCGIEPIWASEIEPYPIAVTLSRFPQMKHLGDISKINGAKIEPVDVITFGSPCQDLSIAGKRAGLKHEGNGDEETTRSGLFMEAVRIIKEMRRATNGQYPTFVIWENVPGAFSSNKGGDFRTVLEELIKIVEPTATVPPMPKGGWPYADCYLGAGWSIAYRTLDAQYWGVPQRRRRIYLVADFRGQRAGKILFEREGLRGYFATGGTPWEGTSGNAERGVTADDREGDGNCLTPWDVQSRRVFTADGQWPALYGGEGGEHGYVCYPILDDQGGSCINVRTDGIAPTLREEMHGNVPCVIKAAGFKAGQSMAGSIGFQEECAATLSAQASGTEPTVCVCYDARGNGDGKTAPTITGDHNDRVTDYTAIVCDPVYCLQGNGIDRADTAGCNGKGVKEDVCYTLNTIDRPAVAYRLENTNVRYIVRRLTPTECARLQGFPDKWGHPDYKADFSDSEYSFWLEVRNTHAAINGRAVKEYSKAQMLTWDNKLHTDSAEYKMWGNGIALPTALYVMQGIADAMKESAVT